MSKKKIKRQSAGFSLVEMILVVGISAIIALAVAQVFLSGTKSYEKNKEMQKNLEEGRSAMEIMAKNIRMSKYAAPAGNTRTIYFYNTSQKRCIIYNFDAVNKKLQSKECTPAQILYGEPVGECNPSAETNYPANFTDMISENVDGMFYVIQTNRTSSPQKIGRATINIGVGVSTSSEQRLQTTASFRDYKDIVQ